MSPVHRQCIYFLGDLINIVRRTYAQVARANARAAAVIVEINDIFVYIVSLFIRYLYYSNRVTARTKKELRPLELIFGLFV